MATPSETSENTLTEMIRASIQIRIPKPTWDGMKIQAIREDVTSEQLAAKAFDHYLAYVSDAEEKRAREDCAPISSRKNGKSTRPAA
jgi:hypothetical protein